ncbi:MAG: hypothetical protein AB1521_09100 [Bacteroidota bacterium]
MIKSTIYILFALLLFTGINHSQIKKVDPGASIGIGEIKSNSPSVTALGGTIFFDFTMWFSEDVWIRTGFSYMRKLEYFLPENREGRAYPFMKLFSLEGVIQQQFTNIIFVEESAGLIYLNDRTFGVNEWMLGTQFSALCALDFTDSLRSGSRVGLGFKYGITFTNTNADYYSLFVQYKLFL